MTKYRYANEDARHFNKHGVDLTVYDTHIPSANVVHVSVEEGHFQEFTHTSTFIYYIVSGEGVFMLNDEPVKAAAGDLVVIPGGTRIHYFGMMEMVLTTTPAFTEEGERHIRFVDKTENPLR